MKRALLFIILGILLIGGVVGVWVYFFLYAETPAGGGAPTSLPESGEAGTFTESPFLPEAAGEGTSAAAVPLSLFSSRRAAGAVIFDRDGAPVVRFVEQGTGHIYERPVSGGLETRVSNRTFAKTRHALWAPSGTRVAITQETDAGLSVFVGSIARTEDGTESLIGEPLPAGAENVGFSATGDIVYYTLPNANGTGGVAWNVASGARQTLFTTALRDIAVHWRPAPVIFTKPAAALRGYAYTASLASAAPAGNGLVGMQDGAGNVLATRIENNIVRSTIERGGVRVTLDRPALPEKCAFTNQNLTLICGVPSIIDARTFPDSWYRGELSFEDSFWTIDTSTGRATFLASPEAAARRSFDVVDFTLDPSGAYGIFRDKTDASLWLLRR